MQFVDAAPLLGTKRTQDGYLSAEAAIARTGIQTYLGREVGVADKAMVRVYRAPEEVFARDSLASFSHLPVTVEHPAVMVDAATWKDVAVGETSDEVLRDGERLRVPLILKDAAAIATVEGGKRELSVGYTCDIAWEPGTTPDGEAYDAVQKNIRANHVAIVARGRAGSEVRIGDDAAGWGIAPITQPTAEKGTVNMADTLRTVVVDGLSVQTTDQGAQAIEKLIQDRVAVQAKLSDAEKAHGEALAAKDAELAKKDAEIDDIKGKVLDEAALDARVQARSDLIATAKSIVADVKTDGVTDAEIRKAVVLAKRGEGVKDKSQAYVDAAFDLLAEDAAKNADPLRQVAKDGARQQTNDNGQAAYEQRVAGAWKEAK